MGAIETDYLVIGAGAAGMAFTDSLIDGSDADVVMVDRRDRPGGHWNDAYPFVRLHQPSSFYGVNSRVLGTDSIDETGPNAGLYERATAPQICDYFQQVLDEHLLASGQVRHFGMADYVARVRDASVRLAAHRGGRPKCACGARWSTPPISRHRCRRRTRRASVSTRMSASSRSTISCGRPIPGAATRSSAPARPPWTRARGFSTTACPRKRSGGSGPATRGSSTGPRTQPLALVSNLIEGVANELESAANAENVDDLFRRLEASGQLRPSRPHHHSDDVPVRDRQRSRARESAPHRERRAQGTRRRTSAPTPSNSTRDQFRPTPARSMSTAPPTA